MSILTGGGIAESDKFEPYEFINFTLPDVYKEEMLQYPAEFCILGMSKTKVWTLGAVFVGCFFLSSLLVGAQGSITQPDEVNALRTIKRNLIDPNKNLSNWNRGDPCTSNWTGVLCYNTTLDDGYLHVQELQLLNLSLFGTLSPALGRLSHLLILDFMWNKIAGSIPKEIGNISTLQLLLLSGNQLTGSLPDELGYLPNLDRIQIDENYISGPLPTSFANLNKTKHFHMNNNLISGQIPPEFSRLSYLVHMLLDNNNLSGHLPPELGQMPNLTILQLDNNNFDDGTTIPESYGSIPTLLKLSLRNCNLQGSIPDLSRIPNLGYLDLSSNNLNGSIPTNKLSENITTVDLSNNHLSGTIPANFLGLPLLQKLTLAKNSLNGSIPSFIWQNRTQNATESLTVDLEYNSLVSISGSSDLPPNVTLWLKGNPICSNTTNSNLVLFCRTKSENETRISTATNSIATCPLQSCPYEYSPTSPTACYCAEPLLIGYRLKSPGFADFPPYINSFEEYLTTGLNLFVYQLYIYSFAWQEGPRLGMYLKLYPVYNPNSSTPNLFNKSEVRRIRSMFTGWRIPESDIFGPFELLNFTLPDIYKGEFGTSSSSGISEGALARIILGIIGGALTLIVLLIIWITCLGNYCAVSKGHQELVGVGPRPNTFNYAELRAATDDFSPSNKLGEGGFGPVYKGNLFDGRVVAVKQLSIASYQGESQFVTEIATISMVQHRNLVKLYGCCIEGNRRLLVYEYLENKSLDQALFGKKDLHLDWPTRFSICLATARGLAYLHEESRPRIIHRDVKASNILLDAELCPKISDFGLAKLYDDMKTHISTRVAGTIGYLAPEYAMRGHLTEKADVFGFGVVALEIVSGRPNSDNSQDNDKIYLLEWAWTLYESNQSLGLMDPTLVEFDENEALRMIRVGLLCTQASPRMRPPMSRVVAMLAGYIEMSPVASKPSYLTDWDFEDITASIEVENPPSTGSKHGDNKNKNNLNSKIDLEASSLNVTEFSDIIGEGR